MRRWVFWIIGPSALIALIVVAILVYREESPLKEGRVKLETYKAEPNETKGAPYPPAKPSGRIPNVDDEWIPVPTGPKVGDMKPGNPALKLKKAITR